MFRRIITALDIGSSNIRTVVAEARRGKETLSIAGIGIAPSAGIRRGVIIDFEEAAAAVRASVEEARRASGVAVGSTWIVVGGSQIAVSSTRGVIAVSRADGQISPEDVGRVVAAAETFIPKNPNRDIIHVIPRSFKVDQESGIRDPVGMFGMRLEVDTLFVESPATVLKTLFKCVEHAGMRVEGYVFSPFAAAEAILTKRQKELGVMLIDIGGGTSSFIVYDEGILMNAGVLPVGGNHITNDIAIGLKTSVDVAEAVKRAYGSSCASEISKRDTFRLSEFIPDDATVVSRRMLAEIIDARFRDIFELAQKELKKIGRAELLPAGVVLVGGASLTPRLIEFTRSELGLPAERGTVAGAEVADEATLPSLAASLGLLRWVHTSRGEELSPWHREIARLGGGKMGKWLKSILP